MSSRTREEELHRWTKRVHTASGDTHEQERRVIVRHGDELAVVTQVSDPEDIDWRDLEQWRVTEHGTRYAILEQPGVVA